MDAVFAPEPSEPERKALLAALDDPHPDRYASAWREAALREGVGTDEAVTAQGDGAFNQHDVLPLW